MGYILSLGFRSVKRGLTLIELIVAMGIVSFLALTLSASIINLQAYTRLDNHARKMKTMIMSTQMSARTSLVVTNNSGRSFVSLGWLIAFKNEGNNLRVTRRSVFFDPYSISGYNIAQLDKTVEDFRTYLSNNLSIGFDCYQDTFVVGGQGVVNLGSLRISPIFCSDSNNNKDYYTEVLDLVNLDYGVDPGEPSSCFNVNLNSIFFSYGYGIPATDRNARYCTIKIVNMSGLSYKYGLRLDARNGYPEVCGSRC